MDNRKKCLFIVGAGLEQVHAYKLASEMGLEVVASDQDPNAPAFQYADYKIIASTRNPEETVSEALKFNQRRKIDGVMTLANDVPYTIASVAKALNLPGISMNTARIGSDKLLMKQVLQSYGVPVPEYSEIFSANDVELLSNKWGLPLVIKPNDGRGARGVIRITGDVDLNWAFKHAMGSSDDGRVIAEKYVAGPQLSTESMMYKENCYTASISHRNYDLLEFYHPFIIENGGILPADLLDKDIIQIENVIVQAAQALHLANGTIKGDIVLSENGPVIIEVALRLSGGYLCTDQIPLARGVDLVQQTIKLSLGEVLSPNDLIPKDIHKMGIRYFFPKPGRITKISGFNKLDKYDWISKKELHVTIGDTIEAPQNHTQRVGFVHALGKTFKEAEERAIFAVNEVKIITTPVL
jgi:biotin carboxylase